MLINFLTGSSLEKKCWVGAAVINAITPHSIEHFYYLGVSWTEQWPTKKAFKIYQTITMKYREHSHCSIK